MKNILLAFLGILILSACDNELDINAEYEDLTVMYGMLDPNSDTNYVRIQRGYLGQDAASASFGISDSLYYDSASIDVYIREYNPGAETFSTQSKMIYDDSFALNEGTFTTEGHHVYRVPSNVTIESEMEYEIVVVREDGTISTARTGIVGEIQITRPLASLSARIFNGQIQFKIDQETGIDPEATIKMAAYQPIIYFSYKEVNLSTKVEELKTVVIRLPLHESTFDQVELLFTGSQLYSALADRIEADSTKNILRFFQGMNIEIVGASEELLTFIELSKPTNGVNQNRPQYEQVINGTGIISSRTTVRRSEIKLQSTIADRLQESRIACDLNFATVELGGTDTCYCVRNEKRCF
jgi:hypothetical protein